MEHIWLHWVVFWITIPFTLTIFWMWLKLLEKSRFGFGSKQTIHQNDIEMQSKPMLDSDLTSCQNQFGLLNHNNNDLAEKFSITTRRDGLKETNFTHEISSVHKHPPDIYVINENGRKVKYIMCV